MNREYKYFDRIMALFVMVLVVSNIASSAKIIDLGFSIFNIPLAFDAGTLLFPISYIFGDILTEVYGYKRSRRVIWTGFAALALSALIFWVVQQLPGEATWQEYAGDEAYRAILGGMSSGGIVLASLSAYCLGEFSNSFVLAKMKILTHGRWLWTRTIGSTLVGDTGGFRCFHHCRFPLWHLPVDPVRHLDIHQLPLQNRRRSPTDPAYLCDRQLPETHRGRRLL